MNELEKVQNVDGKRGKVRHRHLHKEKVGLTKASPKKISEVREIFRNINLDYASKCRNLIFMNQMAASFMA